MKTRKLLVVAALLTFTIIACKEEETKFGASISPIQNVVNSLPSFGYFRDEPTVFGTQFRSSKDGRITELGIRAGKGTYSVAVWDSSAQNIITSTTITATDSTVFVYKDITDLAITANKVYIVSMNNQIAEGGGSGTHVYRYGITDYPFIQGDITLLRSCYRYTGGGSIFPFTTIGTDNISGIASFKFEPKL
jgi:hypothetical protein